MKLAPVTGNPASASEPLWVPFGEETWLVSLATELAGTRSALIAVRADPILAALPVTVPATNSTGNAKFIQATSRKASHWEQAFRG